MEIFHRNIPKELAVRVISGTARGCGLIAPLGLKTRPTGDRMKEDLFNILAPFVQGSFFLDVYCGSGAIGIEALSRGAKSAIFVDSSKEAVNALEANLLKTRLRDQAKVFHVSANQALQQLQGQMFDIIFMDPPYDSREIALSLALISQGDFLAKEGIIVIECPVDLKLPEILKETGLITFRQKKYTQMQFVFLRKDDRDN